MGFNILHSTPRRKILQPDSKLQAHSQSKPNLKPLSPSPNSFLICIKTPVSQQITDKTKGAHRGTRRRRRRRRRTRSAIMEAILKVPYDATVKVALTSLERNLLPDAVVRRLTRLLLASRLRSGYKPSSELQLADLLRFALCTMFFLFLISP